MTLFSLGGKFIYTMTTEEVCSFHSFHSSVNCSNSDTFCLIESIPSTEASVILTESGLLYTKYTKSLKSSKSLLKLHEKNRMCKKRKSCGIPLHIAAHSSSNQKRKGKLKADRHFSLQQVEDKSRKFVTVLPVSTGM